MTDSVAQDQLKSFVRRIESEEDVKKAANEALSDIYKEARGNGFDVKVLRKVIADRRKDSTERNEFEAIYDLYWSALHGVAHAHVEIIEEFDPATGEILEPTPIPQVGGDTDYEDSGLDACMVVEVANLSPETATSTEGELAAPIGEERPASAPVGPMAGDHPGGENVDHRPAQLAGEPVTNSAPVAHSPAPEQPQQRQGYVMPAPKPARPHCQAIGTDRPCAGQGRQHCYSCKSAAEAAGKVAA